MPLCEVVNEIGLCNYVCYFVFHGVVLDAFYGGFSTFRVTCNTNRIYDSFVRCRQ